LGTFNSKFYGRSTPFSAELVVLRRIIWCGLSSLFWEITLSSEMEFSWVKCLLYMYISTLNGSIFAALQDVKYPSAIIH
jgi:hypothetical protein